MIYVSTYISVYDAGQFYYRTVRIHPYTRPLPSVDGPFYTVTIPGRPPEEPRRRLIGQYYQLNWISVEHQCLYVGNSQAGPEFLPGLSASVIAADPEDYCVDEPFTEVGFRFGLFNSDVCDILNGTPPPSPTPPPTLPPPVVVHPV